MEGREEVKAYKVSESITLFYLAQIGGFHQSVQYNLHQVSVQ